MAQSKSENPTELELRILKIIWERSPLTARQIRDALAGGGRELAHTSVITTLQKMVEKGQVTQLEPVEGKAYRFAPRVTEKKVSQRMLGDLVTRVFDGSAEAVVLSLLDVSEMDADMVARLRRILNKKMREEEK
jgi:BlaI family penicillinase repressor